jgi:flagellin-like hook-associated protein FlgL
MTAERMQAIVRKAQRNFQFAMIYEQRKTNQILVAGFTSLAQALDQMSQSITTAIDSLAKSVDSMSSSLGKSMRRIESRLDNISETTSDYLDDQAGREEKTIEMLDNIQRGRKPYP